MDLPVSLSWRLKQALPENVCSEGVFADLSRAILTHYGEAHRAYHNLGHLKDLFWMLDQAAAWHEAQCQRHAACGDTVACNAPDTGTGRANTGAGAPPVRAERELGNKVEGGRLPASPAEPWPVREQPMEPRPVVREPLSECPVSVVLAAFFHDIVYDPRQGDNEEASAALAADRLRSTGVSERVRRIYKP